VTPSHQPFEAVDDRSVGEPAAGRHQVGGGGPVQGGEAADAPTAEPLGPLSGFVQERLELLPAGLAVLLEPT